MRAPERWRIPTTRFLSLSAACAAVRGDWEQAKRIFPDADHEANKRDLEKLAPPSKSKANQKAHDAALKQLQYEAP